MILEYVTAYMDASPANQPNSAAWEKVIPLLQQLAEQQRQPASAQSAPDAVSAGAAITPADDHSSSLESVCRLLWNAGVQNM